LAVASSRHRRINSIIGPMRPLAAAALLLATVAAAPAGGATDRVSRTLPLGRGVPVHVDATIADVTITGGDRAGLEIAVERRAPQRDALSRFPVVVDEREDGVHVAVEQSGEARDPALAASI